MSRDHLLYAGAGLMVGFVLAYFAFENIGSRQPARRPPGSSPAAAEASPGIPGPAEGADNGNGTPGPRFTMEQVQQVSAYVKEHPDDADAVLQLANMNFDIRDWPRAAELYERRISLKPGEADVYSDVGICYREMKEYQKALDAFNQAQQLNPQHWESRFNEVVVLALDLHEFDAAEKVLDELRQLSPDNPDVKRLAEEVERRRNQA